MKRITKFSVVLVTLVCGVLLGTTKLDAFADENEELQAAATSISISPVSKILQISANSTYEDTFKVTNNSDSDMKFEVYAAPYSYTYSEADDSYRLGFNRDNNYTQMKRWISFKDASGNFVEKAVFTAEPNGAIEVSYKITTPESIPAGGQYAVLFAHTLSNNTTSSGIKTEASPGLVIYGRAEGETKVGSEISGLEISQTKEVDGETKNIINGTAKVKNTGNVDFMASGKLKVSGIFGQVFYETPATSTRARTSIIPESELPISDSWDDTAFFGLFSVEWTVSASGSEPQTISKLILIMPPVVIVIIILLLTIIIVWLIIVIRKRKERRAKFMV
ncbi:hypothetical protein IJH33_01495 [Candidatus Saccharibacteria bacterium]|nr:hypothetical protein [Candidatus Saccharibacteria bacterium]